MSIGKVVIAGVAVVVIAALLVPPVQAHRKYRPHYKGLPRHILVQHSHGPQESAESPVAAQAKTESFDLFNGTAHIIIGAVKTLGKVASTVLGGGAEAADEMQRMESHNGAPLSDQ